MTRHHLEIKSCVKFFPGTSDLFPYFNHLPIETANSQKKENQNSILIWIASFHPFRIFFQLRSREEKNPLINTGTIFAPNEANPSCLSLKTETQY